MTETPKTFDLATFDSLTEAQEDGIDVHIEHPGTGEPLGITIRVAGPDSERQRKAYRRLGEKRLRAGRKKLTTEEMEEDAFELLARSLISWTFAPGVTIGGEVPAFDVDAAKGLFRRFPWIREQVDMAAGSRAGFLKSSPPTS